FVLGNSLLLLKSIGFTGLLTGDKKPRSEETG
ncbi:MAG: hypothetical protein RIR58_887, partial [Actinomycetota bacterium]